MTVKQPPLHQPCHSQGRKQDELLTVCNQIKEITGIHDEKVIKRAIDACQDENGKFDIENVVAMLVAEDSQVISNPPKKSPVNPLPPRTLAADTLDARPGIDSKQTQSTETQSSSSHATNKNQGGVIDLTTESNDGDELQKAIAASLQDTQGILGGQVSREEQDISRVLEQSLIEIKAGTKRKRGDIWFVDPLNPYERKRQDGCPVGLKNVGNTCWFSAVIQSLFYLKRFRHLVLNFKLPKDPAQQETRNVRFMTELRHLFALMIRSQRKYVDPSKAVDILKEAFAASAASGVGDSQQDVSEFQHKLLEWLEDAFKTTFRPTSPENGAEETEDRTNPMVELFYGQYRAEGVNEGKGFSNEENFGQFPLQVNGFRDVHESLEAATAHGAIETVSSDTTQTSGQELWFTKLPPVLTFELSRFQFNQQLGRPEKIHNKIEFPQVIYMDRYMICNKTETRQRRERVKKLKDELSVLLSKLDKFNHYGSGSKKVPLQDVLSYALEFAKSKPEPQCLSLDIEMESPKPHSSMVTDSTDVPMTSPTPPSVSPTKKAATPMKPNRTNILISNPSPKHVEDSELKVLQECLRRWRTEVEQDVRGLQENINMLEDSINRIYGDEAMKKCPYHLHAVLVHEGQAASGHYWAYVWALTKWLKFNDISVTDASWDDLVKESVGGYHNASAYCLMYVDKSKLDATEENCDTDILPDDLMDKVTEDNNKFQQEMEDWDKEQARKAAGAGDADCTITGETKPGTGPSTSTVATQTQLPSKQHQSESTLAVTHAMLSANDTYSAAQKAASQESFQLENQDTLSVVIENELLRIEQLVKQLPKLLPKEDWRLVHPVIYLKACHAPKDVIHKFMLEQFSLCTLLTQNEKYKQLLIAATYELKQRMKNSEKDDQMTLWHERFHQFRKIVYFFVQGLQFYNDEKYDKALPYLIHTYSQNKNLLKNTVSELGVLSVSLLGFYRRQCLLHMNDMLTHQFENQVNISETMSIMNNYIVPCLPCILQSGFNDDTSVVEEIREKWCSFLGQEIDDKKVEMLQDLLSKLFEPPGDINVTRIPAVLHSDLKILHKEYSNLMQIAEQAGYLEKALQSK